MQGFVLFSCKRTEKKRPRAPKMPGTYGFAKRYAHGFSVGYGSDFG